MTSQSLAQTWPQKFVAWISRAQVWGFFVSLAVMAAVSLAFFAPDNFEGNTLEQHDMQQGAANGEEGRAWYEQTGEKALWTNALFSGMPTFQISPSYPSNNLFTWLNSFYGLGLPAPSNLMFMMMLGMLILCYCCGMRWWYALIGALAWGLSSYFVIIIGAGHIWKFTALTYMPPTVGAMILAYRGRWLWGGALTGMFAMLQLNANHPQITYYCLYIMAVLAGAYLVRAIARREFSKWLIATAVCIGGGILAVGANGPSLYHTWRYSKETKRAQSELIAESQESRVKSTDAERPTGGLPKAEIGGWSNTPSESFSLLIPNIKGGATIRPAQGTNHLMSLDQAPGFEQEMLNDDVANLIPQLPQYFGGKGLTNGPFYLGVLIMALFFTGCIIVRGPVKWGLLVLTLFSVLLAMGNHFSTLTDFMIYNVPLYNKFRAAETALVIAAMCVPLLAMMALQQLFDRDKQLPAGFRNLALAVGFGLSAFICFLAAIAPAAFGSAFSAEELQQLDALKAQLGQYPVPVQDAFKNTLGNIETLRYGLVTADAWRSLLFVVFGAVVVWGSSAGKLRPAVGALCVGAIVVVDLCGVDKRYLSSDSFMPRYQDAVDPLAADAIDNQILADEDYYRVADLQAPGDARRSFYHHMIGGYHAAKLNRYNDLIDYRMRTVNAVGEFMPEYIVNDSLPAELSDDDRRIIADLQADYRVLNMLNARYIITRKGQLVRNTFALGPAWLVDSVRYVDGARAEMDALKTLRPERTAVADRQFAGILGSAQPSVMPGDTVSLVRYTPNATSYDVTTRNGGTVVFSEVWFPWGWHATIDGKPAEIARVNYVLRAMHVPAGHHEVTLRFDPQSLHTTGHIAYASVTLIYLWLALALFTPLWRRRKPCKNCSNA